jgi:hypothetical protein
MSVLMDDLELLPRSAWTPLRCEALVAGPQKEIKLVCNELGLGWDLTIQHLSLSKVSLTPPEPDKWRRNEQAVMRVKPLVEQVQARVERILGTRAHAGNG